MALFPLAYLCCGLHFHAFIQKGADSLCLKTKPCSFELHKDDHGHPNVKQSFVVPPGSRAFKHNNFLKNVALSPVE